MRQSGAGADGVVCGHIHHAEMRMIDGVLYCNDGDWVESLTALVEHADGRLEILDRARRAGHCATVPHRCGPTAGATPSIAPRRHPPRRRAIDLSL